MPFNPFNRKPIGQTCQNQIIALVLFSIVKTWFLLFTIVFLQIHLFISFFEKYAFCFSPYVLLMKFLFFDFIFSITLPPVQTLNPIGKNVPNLQFWVSFLVKDTKCFEKTKDCLIDWFVSSFKFCFLNNFILHYLHQFGSKFLCKLVFFSQIWGFILCKESFRARNCRDLQLCFISLCIRIWFLKLPVFFSKHVVNRHFFSGFLLENWPLG